MNLSQQYKKDIEECEKQFGMVESSIATQENQQPIKLLFKQSYLNTCDNEIERLKSDYGMESNQTDEWNNGYGESITDQITYWQEQKKLITNE